MTSTKNPVRRPSVVLLILSAVLLTGCHIGDPWPAYSPVSKRLPRAYAVKVTITNPVARLKVDSPWSGVKPYDRRTSPPAAKFVEDALKRELAAAGIKVRSQGPLDALIKVKIENLIIADRYPFWFGPLILYQEGAGIIEVMVTVVHPESRRKFRRRFAAVTKDTMFQFIVPFGIVDHEELLEKSMQDCFSELTRELHALMRNI